VQDFQCAVSRELPQHRLGINAPQDCPGAGYQFVAVLGNHIAHLDAA
jgi:hypothetical protein